MASKNQAEIQKLRKQQETENRKAAVEKQKAINQEQKKKTPLPNQPERQLIDSNADAEKRARVSRSSGFFLCGYI